MSDSGSYIKESWYIFLKKKYSLNDEEMQEYVDSYVFINKGDPINSSVLAAFVEDTTGQVCDVEDAKVMIQKILKKVGCKDRITVDLQTYLQYTVPISQTVHILKMSARELFEMIDTDHDKKIDCQQLVNLMYKLKKNTTPELIAAYEHKIRSRCSEIDSDMDGTISYDEFYEFMMAL